MENIIVEKSKDKEIPEEVLNDFINLKGIKKNDELLKNWDVVKSGNVSPLISIEDENGNQVKGKFRISEVNGDYKMSFFEQKTEITINDDFLGYKLTDKDKENLKKGDMIGPVIVNDKLPFFLKLDNDLNRTIIERPQDLKVPYKIGDHFLSAKDIDTLEKGKSIDLLAKKSENLCVSFTFDPKTGKQTINHLSENESKDFLKKATKPDLHILHKYDDKTFSLDKKLNNELIIVKPFIDNIDIQKISEHYKNDRIACTEVQEYIKNKKNIPSEHKYLMLAACNVPHKSIKQIMDAENPNQRLDKITNAKEKGNNLGRKVGEKLESFGKTLGSDM